VGVVPETPGEVRVRKAKHDIDVSCTKSGFVESKYYAESGTEGYTLGNLILGGPIAWGVDSIIGADNKYPSRVTVNLARD
jgi:hypothetical protein